MEAITREPITVEEHDVEVAQRPSTVDLDGQIQELRPDQVILRNIAVRTARDKWGC